MISEETLTLYYYNDGLDVAQRREVAAALDSDRVLAARFAALTTDLDALYKPGDIRAPEYLKHQWHDLVAREAQLERQKAGSPPRPFPWLGLGAAFTAVLALGVAIGVWMPRDTPTAGPQIVAQEHPPVARVGTASAAASRAAFERGLQVYLQESQGELASLGAHSSDEQNSLILNIIMQNRLFEQAAEKQQNPEIARLMRAVEPILLRLAAGATTPEDAAALRRQLTFELNAMLTKLQQPASNTTTTT